MGFTTKNKSTEGLMGFLFVFFPEEHHNHNHNHHQQQEQESEEPNKKTPTKFNLFSSSSSSFKRTNSANLLQKAQSTISICLLLLFTTLLLFTLSALPSSSTTSTTRKSIYNLPRRHLIEFSSSSSSTSVSNLSTTALQGMGTLYRRGTRAMNELIVAHAVESLTLKEFKLFVRLFYRSSLSSRSDLLFIFPSKIASFDSVVLQEHDSFLKLVTQYGNSSERSSFDVTQFVKVSEKDKESGETIWGVKFRGNFSEEAETESTRPSYGSVVGFDVEELDPENSLSGFFLEHVPMSLRRWACYPMLLGRVKKYFKHVMLVDMKEILVLGDPLFRVRSRSPESVVLKTMSQSGSGKHGKKNLEKTRQKRVDPGIIMGAARGVRRLSNAMLTDIVRAAMQHKKKNPVTESGLFNQLVGNEYVLKNVNLEVSSDSVPELSSRVRANSDSGSHLLASNETVIRRGNSNFDVHSMVMKHICSFPLDSAVYSDC